jgi:hypothetical protein
MVDSSKFIEGNAFYSSEIEIHCRNSKQELRYCGQSENWVQKYDIENPEAISDLLKICETRPKQNITLTNNNNNSLKPIDIKSLVIVSVITAITSTVIIFILLGFALFLKRKFSISQSSIENNSEAAMPAVNDFSFIEVKHNIANRRRFSEISNINIYSTPIFANDDEMETCFSSSVASDTRRRTAIILTYSEPFDSEINRYNITEESNNENIYSEPYVSAESDIYSQH